MGLLSTEVEVRVNGATAKHYESLGYILPKKPNGKLDYSKTIIVKVDDLPQGSGEKVDVEYDCCHKKTTMKYVTYRANNHNGKIYCIHCAPNILISGKKHYNWNPNKTQEERELGRNYPEYIAFIKRVLARDHYTCQCCGKKHEELEVHHLNGYSWYIEGRTDDTNALTLCSNCHTNYHSQYGNKHSTKEEFEEWFGMSINLLKSGIKILPCRQIYCVETDKVYKNAQEVCKEFNIKHNSMIYRVCNYEKESKYKKPKTINGYHFLWYDVYEKNKNNLDEYLFKLCENKNHRKVICLETLEVFDTILSVVNKYRKPHMKDVVGSQVINACKSTSRTAYSLHWMYYDDYLKKIEKGESITFTTSTRTVICITTGKVFNQAILGAKYYGLNGSANMLKVCKGVANSAGKLPDGTPLKWMYYEDFLKLPQEEQNEILSRNKESSSDGSFNMQN